MSKPKLFHSDIITMVPADVDIEEICEWCQVAGLVTRFAVNTYKIYESKEYIVICHKCEIQARKVGKGAINLNRRWIPAIKKLREKVLGLRPES